MLEKQFHLHLFYTVLLQIILNSCEKIVSIASILSQQKSQERLIIHPNEAVVIPSAVLLCCATFLCEIVDYNLSSFPIAFVMFRLLFRIIYACSSFVT